MAVEYSPFPRKLRNVNRKIRAVSLYTRGRRDVCMNEKRGAAWSKKIRIRAQGGEEKTRVYYTHASVFFEKVFKEKLLRPDRDVSFAEMDGAPVRFFVLSIVALYHLCQPRVG